jgi:hypothetical protein
MGMNKKIWVAAIVLAHLIVTIVHGAAHTKAQVPLSPAASAFVFSVILAGPLVGLALTLLAGRIGAWVVAATMASALVFGFVNHFVFASPDHIAHVDQQARPLFVTTAVLLALTEAVGFGLAISSTRLRRPV